MATTQKRVKMPKQNRKRMTTSSYVMIIGLLAFVAMIGILFQHAVITEKKHGDPGASENTGGCRTG